MDQCRKEGCERPVGVKQHGVCRACYERMRRNGEVGSIRSCSVEGCKKRAAARELCDMHYKRVRNRGTTQARTIDERLKSKIDVQDGGCWVWTDSRRTGYGFLLVDGVKAMAHRVAYEEWVGPIPAGMQIDHLCRNKMCVNPDHLEPVTQQENILRSENMAAMWARRTACHVCGGELEQRKDRRVCLACRRRKYRQRKTAS